MRTLGERIAAPGRLPEATGSPDRAVRGTVNHEIDPANLDVAGRLLAAMPRRLEHVADVTRVAAAGHDLAHVCAYLRRMREMIRDGELPPGSKREERLLAELEAAAGELVGLVEAHLGAFPASGTPGRDEGLRETYLVDLAPERRDEARWIVDLARQASDLPRPLEPVARMMLRGVGDDVREVGRYLDRLSAWIGDDRLRELAAAVASGCGELAASIAGALPPGPGGKALAGGAGGGRHGSRSPSTPSGPAGRSVEREVEGR